jgi:hypothetical protein
MNYKVYTEIDAAVQQLGTNINLQEKCNHFLYDRRTKMQQWKQAAQNQLSACDWMKQNIYNEEDDQ